MYYQYLKNHNAELNVRNKRKTFFIILSVLAVLAITLPLGASVYADETETATSEPVTGQTGEYTYTVIEHYDDQWPEGININIEYERYSEYPAWPHYIVNINGDRQRVYQGPSKYRITSYNVCYTKLLRLPHHYSQRTVPDRFWRR